MHKPISISTHKFAQGGGIESYTIDLARQLSANNKPVKVYASKFDQTLIEYAEIQPVLINQKHTPKKLRPFYFTRQLNKLHTSAEYLIACSPSDNADIYICGGTHLGYLKAMHQSPNLIDCLAIYRNRTNYATAKSIMAHSEMMRQELITLYDISPEKIQTIHPPADTSRFTPETTQELSATRQQYGWNDDEVVFLFPSTGHRRKGFDLLANYFQSTNLPIRLAVAGSPLPHPVSNVQELGFCKNMPELYRAADYTIMASLYEPFGLVGVESILCGTRVVLSENMACCEVMNEEAGFFFSRENHLSLDQAIHNAITLKQQGKHKLSNPLSALTYNPSIEHHIARLYSMLDSLE
ncbi:glycosyltransferase family 4 protein [Eikenella sp. S3360]|uniref:Glycosyltransferase family 4 protein n=1 Tax=Eikenella glucosivorans TaxID=2766967 RepID=A0ABS0N8E9_9NEIS|nr:glycosyltransferase family 4 protein [Eikenella glucosivorans]MBH5328579.1 glycosyltransferase family 4 protein [Eikenella glucosivorans]